MTSPGASRTCRSSDEARYLLTSNLPTFLISSRANVFLYVMRVFRSGLRLCSNRRVHGVDPPRVGSSKLVCLSEYSLTYDGLSLNMRVDPRACQSQSLDRFHTVLICIYWSIHVIPVGRAYTSQYRPLSFDLLMKPSFSCSPWTTIFQKQ